MSDYYSAVRARRRVQEGVEPAPTQNTFEDHDLKKNSAAATAKTNNQYNPINTVFNASASQLWNSAQVAFSSIHNNSFANQSEPVSRSLTPEPDFSLLSVFGNPIDKIVITMPSRDRTSEFKTTARSYQMKVQTNDARPQSSQEVLASSIQFNQLAKRIGRDLSQTCAKMEKLAEMAKKKSLFDERSNMNELQSTIRKDITGLNGQIAMLQDYSQKRSGVTSANQGSHSKLVVVGLQSKLANVTKDFKTVLDISTENMKHQKTRREKFSNVDNVPMSLPSSSSTPNVRSRLLMDDEQHGGGSVTLDMNAVEQYRTQQSLVMQDQSRDYINARSNAMESIEGSISELGQIFSQLAHLVSEQGEMITRIDSNVDETAINIDSAHTELVRYFHNISKNRWLMIKVFGVLMVFFVIFVLFLTFVLMRVTATIVGLASLVATSATVTNAFLINKQFFPSMVYLTKSSSSMAVIYFQGMVIVYTIFQLLRKVFFGDLRAAEADHLSDRSWHAILETCLAFTVFREDFSPLFVMQFVLLLFVKCFHWLGEDRVDVMERSPVITTKFHLRMVSVIAVLAAVDSFLLSHAYFSFMRKGIGAQIIFGFEYAILLFAVIHISIKYILHMFDLRSAQSWDNKAVYLLYAELVINLFRTITYGFFAVLMMKLHTLPLFSIRPFYMSLRALTKAFHDVVQSRKAINAMNNLFPVVSAEELASMDSTCIICREEMTVDSQPKRLPCSHVFHVHCLRSWFQRQQTCPTCRTDILAGRGGVQNGNAAPQAPVANREGMPPANFMPFLAHQFAFPGAQLPNGNPQPAANAHGGGAGNNDMQPPPFGFPPFMPPHPPFMGNAPFLPGFFPPPPPPPLPFPSTPSFDGLSNEELAALEGTSREAVENRIRLLQNLNTLLDATSLMWQQYLQAMSRLPAFPQPSNQRNAAETSAVPNTNITTHNNVTAESEVENSTAPLDEPSTSNGVVNGNNDSVNSNRSNSPMTEEHQSNAEELRQRRLRRFEDSTA